MCVCVCVCGGGGGGGSFEIYLCTNVDGCELQLVYTLNFDSKHAAQHYSSLSI